MLNRLLWFPLLLIITIANAVQPRIFPLSLLDFPQDRIEPSSIHTAEDLVSKYPAYNFTQLTTHFAPNPPYGFNQTFQQRYWIDIQYYKPTGPVIVIEGGEASAVGRLPTMDTGLGRYLAEALNGVVILLEHRYYGESIVTKDLSTHSLQLLTTEESLADTAYFAENFPYTSHPELPFFIPSNSTPWIHYGGSYGGGKSAFLRHLYPNQIWGSIASSAVVWATDDFWQYFEPVRQHGDPKCIQNIENVIATLDKAIAVAGVDDDRNYVKSPTVVGLMKLFGLEELENVQDWMATLSYALDGWQGQNWDGNMPGAYDWARFCVELTAGLGDAADASGRQSQVPLLGKDDAAPGVVIPYEHHHSSTAANPITNFANYIKNTMVKPCLMRGSTVEECFSTKNMTAYYDTSLSQTRRLWPWQVCLEWGYAIGPAPANHSTLVSRTLGGAYNRQICNRAFGFDAAYRPNVTRINRWGNFSLEAPRLLYVDGDQDPWLYATVHSPLAEEYGRNVTGKDREDGIFLTRAWHHSDENGLGDIGKEPERIIAVHRREIEVVRGWVEEWKGRRKEA